MKAKENESINRIRYGHTLKISFIQIYSLFHPIISIFFGKVATVPIIIAMAKVYVTLGDGAVARATCERTNKLSLRS